ncbi:hypothetical protein SNOG_04580 [Parastagonospora nodorum SN15]|uniref:Rhodopsin domain-containing protein n=1 Tax=Phaeosphaeria nodorum (strain SN15 / ATCC MYA-4574 / FGSC 10173) TaxID=321614 RepID=Q0UUI4_PHANO|nr:hypothetical protein SNOG_04580 [Parastagonospora nodorum SN15]EAT88340.2 hypothetical protein SNOG_04580 [Parastagonospora nodorum SN15]
MSAPTPEIIATWPTPNYDNPKSIKTSIEAVVYSTTIAMLLFVGSRIFVRTKSKLGMGVDDWFMTAAAVRIGTTLLQRKSKRHRSWLAWRPRPFFTARSMSLDAIFTTLDRISFRLGLRPIESLWNPAVKKGRCLDVKALVLASMAVNTVSDFIIFLWPVIPLWKVQISLRQRLNLVTVFGFGMVTCVGAIVKIHFAKKYQENWDSTYLAGYLLIMLTIEYNVGIMCGCLPCLRPLLVMIFPKHFASSSAARANYPIQTIGSAGGRSMPFRSHPSNSIKLAGDDMYTYTDTFELDDSKDAAKNPGHSWVEGGRPGEGTLAPQNGIHIQRNISVQHDRPPPTIRVTADASSEEWIMKEDHPHHPLP